MLPMSSRYGSDPLQMVPGLGLTAPSSYDGPGCVQKMNRGGTYLQRSRHLKEYEMKTSTPTLTAQAVKAPIAPALAIVVAAGAAAQPTTPPTKMNEPAAVSSKDIKLQSANMNAVRARKLIGMKVNGAQGKSIGEIMDLIVNVDTGDVRYALLALDPGFFKAEKLFAVPLNELSMDGKKRCAIQRRRIKSWIRRVWTSGREEGCRQPPWRGSARRKLRLQATSRNKSVLPRQRASRQGLRTRCLHSTPVGRRVKSSTHFPSRLSSLRKTRTT